MKNIDDVRKMKNMILIRNSCRYCGCRKRMARLQQKRLHYNLSAHRETSFGFAQDKLLAPRIEI
jgi:hypothetical protein